FPFMGVLAAATAVGSFLSPFLPFYGQARRLAHSRLGFPSVLWGCIGRAGPAPCPTAAATGGTSEHGVSAHCGEDFPQARSAFRCQPGSSSCWSMYSRRAAFMRDW